MLENINIFFWNLSKLLYDPKIEDVPSAASSSPGLCPLLNLFPKIFLSPISCVCVCVCPQPKLWWRVSCCSSSRRQGNMADFFCVPFFARRQFWIVWRIFLVSDFWNWKQISNFVQVQKNFYGDKIIIENNKWLSIILKMCINV